MIMHFLDTAKMGGIEAHVETLARAQRAAGQEVGILVWRRYADSSSQERFRQSGLSLRSAEGSFLELLKILGRMSVTTLHTHGYKANILGRFAARMRCCPVVSTFHAGERAPFPVSLYQALDEWSSFLGKRIAVSRPIAEAMPFRTLYIPNFVEIPLLSAKRPDWRSVSFAGRFSLEKGPDLFCRIAAALKGKLKFAAYGDGPLLEELRRSFADHVVFMGFAHDMKAVWQRTGLLLMPSRSEGLPMAALEAMARGVPVAAASVGDLPQLIENGVNGFLFPAGDIKAAAACLLTWHEMPENAKAAMSIRARETIEMRYSAAAGLAKIDAVYGRCANGSITSKVQSSSGR